MSSSASDPFKLSEIPEQIKVLLSWNPPVLELFPDNPSPKSYTREPAFFDRHFSQDLKLLHVKRLPSLAHDVAAVVDTAIIDYTKSGVQLPPADTLLSAKQYDGLRLSLELRMVDEMAVAEFYGKTTAQYCVRAASTLAFRLLDWDSQALVWSRSQNVSAYTIADGFLTVGDLTKSDLDTRLKDTMGGKTLDFLKELSKNRVSLLTHEFKSMVAGNSEVMEEISKLSNSPTFHWSSCEEKKCPVLTRHEKQRGYIAKVVVGPDAKITPWNLESSPISPSETVRPQPPTGSSSVQGSSKDVGTSKALKRKRDESGASSLLSTLGMPPQASSSLAPEASGVSEIPAMGREPRKSNRLAAMKQKPNDSKNVCSSVCSVRMNAHVKTFKVTKSTDRTLLSQVPVIRRWEGKGKGKAVAKGNVQGGSEDQNSEGDPSFIDSQKKSARSIVQQAS